MAIEQPVIDNDIASIAAGGSGTAIVPVPEGTYFIKQINITQGANVTVTDIQIDGVSVGEIASFDVAAKFGKPLPANDAISASGNNAGAGAENLEIEVIGSGY